MTDSPENECEKLPGRLREICEGLAGLSLEKVNAYREQWGITSLESLPPGAKTPMVPRVAMSFNGISSFTSTRPVAARSCGQCGGGKPKIQHEAPPRKSVVNRAIRLAQAIARHLADDSTPTPEAALAVREAACQDCPNRVDEECRECGCVLYPNRLNQGKLRWRSEACPVGKWFRQRETYRPLLNPTRNLLFHIYPLKGAEWNWHRHIEQIRRHAHVFNGKLAIGIVTGPNLVAPEVVQELLRDVPVTDWVIRQNSKALGETSTFVDLLQCVESSDPNAITFRGHTKGVTHRRNGVEQPWAELMWETCMDLASVEDALASHIMAGPMKCHEPLVSRQKYRWFFAGTFFWFRNREIFERDWRATEKTRWYPEAWPGVMCSNEESACLCHDFTDGSVLTESYWKSHVVQDFEKWKAARTPREPVTP